MCLILIKYFQSGLIQLFPVWLEVTTEWMNYIPRTPSIIPNLILFIQYVIL